ncbi:MAG: anion permease [Oscillospiraceae bacterium]|nr:anion permease [Oscillospiraceae bacterium]
MIKKIKEFIGKEAVLCVAAGCAVLTMLLVPPDREYLHYIDFRVLCLLLCLMAVVAGLKAIGTFHWLTYQILHRIHNGRILSVTLVLLAFFCSMFVTNDVALIIFVPFTIMLLDQLDCRNSIMPVTVFQTIAANLGSMATPVGNPQNLYLYAFYNMGIRDFFSVTVPLTAVSLIILSLSSIPLLPKTLPEQKLERACISSIRNLVSYFILFILCLLTVFRMVPYPITTGITVAVLLLIDRKQLKEIDYMLLLTFVCFFVVSENLGRIESIRGFLQQLLEWNTLVTAVGTSQVISNVPAVVVLSGFTDQWREMLAGVNIGGLGTPIASLASLITMKYYMGLPGAKLTKFLTYFMTANLIGLAVLLLVCRII